MSNQDSFHISVGDDSDHEDLTAEVYYEGAYLALISQENGLDNAEIELQPNPSGGAWIFELEGFADALQRAKCRLWDLRRREE